jgi:hypothetical protein
MTDFGDSEPEDSWHPDDPVPVLLDNILRRIGALRHSFDAVATEREKLRFREIDIDLAFIIERLRH